MRYTWFYFFTLLLLVNSNYSQNVSINDTGNPANANAALDIDASTNDKGILIPRITELQRTAMTLTTTDQGLLVFQENNDSGYWFWSGTAWERLLTSNSTFGEMSNYLEVKDTVVIPLAATWYKIPNFFIGNLQNVSFSNATLTIQKSGYYYMQYSISGYAVAEKQNYEFAFSVNGVINVASEIEQRIDKKFNKESSASGQCIMFLNAGDTVELHVKCDFISGGFVGTHGNVSIFKIN